MVGLGVFSFLIPKYSQYKVVFNTAGAYNVHNAQKKAVHEKDWYDRYISYLGYR